MRIWVLIEDTPSVDFLIPKKIPYSKQPVGFRVYLPMEYVDSVPYFCMVTETVSDLANASMESQHTDLPCPIKNTGAMPKPLDCAPTPTDNRQWACTPPGAAIICLGPGRHLPGTFYFGLTRRPPRTDVNALPHFLRSRHGILAQQGCIISAQEDNLSK